MSHSLLNIIKISHIGEIPQNLLGTKLTESHE